MRFLTARAMLVMLLGLILTHAAWDYIESRRIAGAMESIRPQVERTHQLEADVARSDGYYRAE